ncbi:MAG: T9SS type A sorting domain-containing protein [Sphingobacteriales bacterium]|nr:MAG: T9SS type A sorting domain-containing protein [Sphingobacteriales bacterium]
MEAKCADANKSTTVNYSANYSISKPFYYDVDSERSCSELRINDSGTVRFETMRGDISPIGFNLSAYDKNGVLQSRINRDVIYMLMFFPENRKPIISGINGGNQVRMDIHEGAAVCFNINSFDVDDGDTVNFTRVTGLPDGATFEVEENKRFPKAKFCWTPKRWQASPDPYNFTVQLTDNKLNCGDYFQQGITEKTFSIYVCLHTANGCEFISSGMNETSSQKLNLFPQPSRNAVYVNLNQTKINSLHITDMAGRIFSPSYIWEGDKLKIDTQDLKAGSYVLKIISAQNIYNGKLIIQK